MLVYQRKNRERITSNLDKYYPYEEIRQHVAVESNQKGEKFLISIKKEIEKSNLEDLETKYKNILGKKAKPKEAAATAIEPAIFAKI